MSLGVGYELDAAGLYGGDPFAVHPLPNRYVLLDFFDRLHRRFPLLKNAGKKSTSEV
jgi:hypothetical protein